MKALIAAILFAFSTTLMVGQETNVFKQETEKNPFAQEKKAPGLSQNAGIPELSFKNKEDLNYVKFHSKIVVFQPKDTAPIVIYPFDPKVQGALRVFYPN